MRRKAFTLIELLVVIAIIAILAAILFPVFAQAKEAAKKTQTLSNCKQYGTAVNLYADSADDLMPLAMYISAAGTHFYNTLIPIPAGWFTGGNWATPNAIAGSNVMWGNSMFQYVKSGNLLEVAGAQKSYFAPDDVKTKVKEPYIMGLAYNGMLHAYSMSAAAAPSVNPAFWSGWGKMNSVGRALSNPTLECSGKADCRFIPGEQPPSRRQILISALRRCLVLGNRDLQSAGQHLWSKQCGCRAPRQFRAGDSHHRTRNQEELGPQLNLDRS